MASEAREANPTCPTCGNPCAAGIAAGLCVTCLAQHLTATPDASAASARPPLPPGFDWITDLGQGGMGVVALAHQREPGRYVALKQIAALQIDEARSRERFLREARAVARLNHPGIVAVFEVGSHDGRAWFTMEYVEGGDLAQLLRRNGRGLPWRDAARIVAHVADAVHHAHTAGVVHRDLKPSNILLAPDGRPKVADFGIASLAGHGGGDLTVTGELLGTPAYMAPELAQAGARSADARRADIYSIGAVLFHLVAGRPPFTGETPLLILDAVANRPAPRLRHLPTGEPVPASLEAICDRCLAKNPADRFPDAAALAGALRDCVAGRRIPRPFRLPRAARRTIPTLAALAVVLAAAVLVRDGNSPASPPGAAAPAEHPARPIAVLPLEAITRDDFSLTLAAGLQDQIGATITRITDLRVIEPASAQAARRRFDDLADLGRALGVETLLTMSVQRWSDQIRVTARLVHAPTGETLWVRTFDRRETNLLNLQTDIATDVAVQLQANRRRPEQAPPGRLGSRHPQAQRLFLQAVALAGDARNADSALAEAVARLEQATALDPHFARAFAHLSLLHTRIFSWANDRTEERLRQALEAAQTAAKLDPGLGDAEVALGEYFYRGSRDTISAYRHFERALGLEPDNAVALLGWAGIKRREGDFASSAAAFRRALELDPFNAILAYNTADTFLRMGEYEKCWEILRAALERLPRQPALLKLRGDLFLAWRSDLEPMREEIEQRDPSVPTPELFLFDRIEWLTLAHRPDEALAALSQSTVEAIDGQAIFLTREGFRALLLQTAGRTAEARAAAAAALPAVEARRLAAPNDPRLLLHAGQLLALLGDFTASDRLIERCFDSDDPAGVDAFDRPFFRRAHALVLAMSGRDAEARATLRRLSQETHGAFDAYTRHHPQLARVATLPAQSER